MELNGKVVLVTGAARRVGRAIALDLAAAGCDVGLHYHSSAEDAAELAGQIQALGRRAVLVPGDLGESGAPASIVGATIGQLGRLDILVNNASVYHETLLAPGSVAEWERVFRINVLAPAMLCAAAVPYMRRAGQGRIVNLTDILAERPVRGFSAYCASKSALSSLTRGLAIELAPEITVNAVAPGIAVFPDDYPPDKRQRIVSRVPLAREGTPQDIAAAVRFLVAAGDYITGQTITVDGGWSVPR